MLLLPLLFAADLAAGDVKLAWDPVPGAAGYLVSYGSDPADMSAVADVQAANQTVVSGLTDCTEWYFSVAAYDATRQASQSSAIVSDWPRPRIDAPNPVVARQGDLFTLDITGANFRPGATLSIDHPHVALNNVAIPGCGLMQVVAEVAPAGAGLRPARVGSFSLHVTNPSGIRDLASGNFVVAVDPRRFDLDRSTTSTLDRLNGADLSLLALNWGGCEDLNQPSCNANDAARYLPDLDLDGNGWIDGEDLLLIAMQRWGRCWSPLSGDWTDSPTLHPTAGLICPTVTP